MLSQNKSFASKDSKPFEIRLQNPNEFQIRGPNMGHSFNDSTSSMALRNLFGVSGHHTNVC